MKDFSFSECDEPRERWDCLAFGHFLVSGSHSNLLFLYACNKGREKSINHRSCRLELAIFQIPRRIFRYNWRKKPRSLTLIFLKRARHNVQLTHAGIRCAGRSAPIITI